MLVKIIKKTYINKYNININIIKYNIIINNIYKVFLRLWVIVMLSLWIGLVFKEICIVLVLVKLISEDHLW